MCQRRSPLVNYESQDFPMLSKFGNIAKYYKPPLTQKHLLNNKILHQYSNELPEFFRLNGMYKSDSVYNNPHLEEVKEIDRNQNNERMKSSIKYIKLLGKIKSNPFLSQNQNILGRISSEEIINKRKMLRDRYTNINNSVDLVPKKKVINLENENLNRIFKLYNKSMRIGNIRHNQIDQNSLVYLDKNKNIKCSKLDIDKLKRLESVIDIPHSSYIANVNNYDIKENDNENKRCVFEFERIPVQSYDPILNVVRTYKLPNAKVNKWDKYSEAFSLMDGQLQCKGGLFSESFKKNKINYKVMEMEKEKKLEMKKIRKKSNNMENNKKILKSASANNLNYNKEKKVTLKELKK